jgi:hypothetical protein
MTVFTEAETEVPLLPFWSTDQIQSCLHLSGIYTDVKTINTSRW